MIPAPALGETLVVFAHRDDIEAWYECPGFSGVHPDDDPARVHRLVPTQPACGFRAAWKDPAWVTDEWGEKHCPCGAPPPLYPVGCNFEIVCRCEQSGCDASDCVESVARGWGCPVCGSTAASLRPIQAEPVGGRP